MTTPDLSCEVPTALRIRPTVAVRTLSGTLRAPKRAVILGGCAVALFLLGLALAPAWWEVWLLGLGLPTAVVIVLLESQPRGKTIGQWAYVLLRHRRRPTRLLSRAEVGRTDGRLR